MNYYFIQTEDLIVYQYDEILEASFIYPHDILTLDKFQFIVVRLINNYDILF